MKYIPKDTEYSIEAQFHVLKHFKEVDINYFDLIKKQYNLSDLKTRFELIGSTFCTDFCENPIRLFDALKKIKARKSNISNSRVELTYILSKNEFPNGIGYDNLLHISELSSNEYANIKIETINGIGIKHTKAMCSITFEINVILLKEDTNYKVITIFPGKYAPPFPNKKLQTKSDLEINKEFWNNHVFVD